MKPYVVTGFVNSKVGMEKSFSQADPSFNQVLVRCDSITFLEEANEMKFRKRRSPGNFFKVDLVGKVFIHIYPCVPQVYKDVLRWKMLVPDF